VYSTLASQPLAVTAGRNYRVSQSAAQFKGVRAYQP